MLVLSLVQIGRPVKEEMGYINTCIYLTTNTICLSLFTQHKEFLYFTLKTVDLACFVSLGLHTIIYYVVLIKIILLCFPCCFYYNYC